MSGITKGTAFFAGARLAGAFFAAAVFLAAAALVARLAGRGKSSESWSFSPAPAKSSDSTIEIYDDQAWVTSEARGSEARLTHAVVTLCSLFSSRLRWVYDQGQSDVAIRLVQLWLT